MNPAGLMHRGPALKGPKVMRWVLFADLLEVDGLVDGDAGTDDLLKDLASDECERLCTEDPPFLCC